MIYSFDAAIGQQRTIWRRILVLAVAALAIGAGTTPRPGNAAPDAGNAPASGGPATLVKDINTTSKPVPSVEEASPGNRLVIGSVLFFSAYARNSGWELWKSDGTQAGTALVKDIAPGWGSAYPAFFADVNGNLFFSAFGGLWKSNGTAVGTTLVKAMASPQSLTNVNGTLFSL